MQKNKKSRTGNTYFRYFYKSQQIARSRMTALCRSQAPQNVRQKISPPRRKSEKIHGKGYKNISFIL